MKAIKIFLVLFFIGFTFSCSIYGVKYDYDQQANFAEFRTFDWMRIPEKADIDSFILQRVKNAVNAELKAKGLTLSSNNPDFLIAEHLGKNAKVRVTDWGYGYSAYGRYGRSWGSRGISTHQYEEGFPKESIEIFKKKSGREEPFMKIEEEAMIFTFQKLQGSQ